MMLAALRPIVQDAKGEPKFRAALLLSVAMGGNLGGIATPIGTGPNALAIAAAAEHHAITFAAWMAFGIPLVLGMLLLVYGVLLLRYGVAGTFEHDPPAPTVRQPSAPWVIAIFLIAVVGWLTESFHGVSAPLVSLAATALLFGTGLLGKDDLAGIDWSTLGLIAGGILLGKLVEHTGLFEQLSQQVAWEEQPRIVLLSALVCSGALLSAVMSNTGTAALLIPLAMSLVPTPSMAIIVAIATSFGVPFVMSTPSNAMAYGEGGLKASDLLVVGVPTMIVGCVVLVLTGQAALSLFNVP
jgi:sodium-dependent dicarboxylate transporter 2/3/5